MRARFLLFGLVVLGVTVLAAPVVATESSSATSLNETRKKLDAAAAERDRLQREAVRLGRELQKIRRETIAAARTAQARETEISRIEARLDELVVLEDEKKAALKLDEDGLRQAIAALVRMTRNPPGAMLFQDRPPADTVRGAILLRATVPAIEGRAAQTQHDLEQLVRARAEMADRRADLTRAVARLNLDRARLDDLMKQKTALRATTEADRTKAEARVRKLAREAKSLEDLVGRLAKPVRPEKSVAPVPPATVAAPSVAAPPPVPPATVAAPSVAAPPPVPPATVAAPSVAAPPPAPTRRFSEARGLVPFPAAGRIIGSYGEKLDSGLARKGLSLETRFGAQVIAPFDGSVVFAGPFRGYGHLLIIEHGEGYHTLLAGMARIDVGLGQAVLAGEPIGIMASSNNAGQRPLLYVELRRNSQPIDPKPWLQARKENASG